MIDVVICSAKGCRDEAVWAIEWRNPRIHDGHRRKVWTTCSSHRERLETFLTERSFPVRVVPLRESAGPA